jgi:uncharacterized lipoprotein YddW (UPF0748 family)
VASVANIDWPSRPGLPADSQRAELIGILDRARALRLNAVILQVRPAGDALYASELEPWSEYLTGAQGRPPEPLYDPLAFAVAEAHRRGLELHAWFNPFRARHPSATTPESPLHFSRTHPDLVLRYGTQLWMDPGAPEVREHSIQVILDVVRRYDIDGVHIDDYFYPYPESDAAGRRIDFPDSVSFGRYRAGGGRLARDDWRRRNVDRFVEDLHRAIRRAKPWVKFGVSPFGIWRPGNPPQIQGFDAYAEIYADSRKWLREGWLDYLSPQLYWPIAQGPQSYPVLLRWWVEQNVKERHLWPGNFTSRVAEPTGSWPASEIVGQVLVTRGAPGATGNVHFSERAFRLNPVSLDERLVREAYTQPALVPATPWLRAPRPTRPRLALSARGDSTVVRAEPGGGGAVWQWYVRARSAAGWTSYVAPGGQTEIVLPVAAEEVAVAGVGRNGVLGPVELVKVTR